MGLIRVPVTLKGRKRKVKVIALVDTGASLTVIPRSIAARLELPALRTMAVHLADGRRQRMPVSAAIVRLDGREVPSTVFVAPGGEVLLGAETLELLDVSVDPKRRRLKFGKFFGLKLA
jgi:clan AA aspartic protease